MKRVAEMIYVVPEEREAFLKNHLAPTKEQEKIMWLNGMRNQFYFQFQDIILMTFEYVGDDFYGDMKKVKMLPQMDGFFVLRRRKDVAADQLKTTNWWAPLKIYGKALIDSPIGDDENEWTLREQYHAMVSGNMDQSMEDASLNYSEDDWSESVHF